MFILGTLLNYFLIFPLTVHFLGTYQVSTDVDNMLTLQSYMDTLITMCLVIGVMFELPIVSWLLARMGIINGRMMTLYHSGHCHRSRHYHPHHRCLHTLRRVNAHLAAVRTEHTDSKNDRK